MKLYVHPQSNRTIRIDIEFVEFFHDVAASSRVLIQNRDKVLSPEQRFTEEQMMWYTDLINSVLSVLEDFAGFPIIKQWQSTDSYSYYIKFEALDKDGNSLGDFDVEFRIADHPEKSKLKSKNKDSNNAPAADRIASAPKGKRPTIFRSLRVNNISQSGMISTVLTVQRVCEELLEGNIDVLDELGR